MRKMEIEYNTSRDELIMPEYGRHVQQMIQYAKTIENLELRQAYVDKIVELMYIMNPQGREVEDFRERLWKHAFRIGEYDMQGVMPPNGVIPSPENDLKTPEAIEYPESQARFRHYGHYVQELIKKAKETDDPFVKEGLIGAITAYMKLAYKSWNREHYVSDEVIKADLVTLSEGKLSMPDDVPIENLNPVALPGSKKQGPQQQYKGQQGGQQSGKKKKKNWKRK